MNINKLVKISVFALCTTLVGCASTSGTTEGAKDKTIIGDISTQTKECIAIGGYDLTTGDSKTLGLFIDAKVAQTEGKAGFKYTQEEVEKLRSNLTLEMIDDPDVQKHYITEMFGCRGGESKDVASLNEIIDEVNYSVTYIANIKKKELG